MTDSTQALKIVEAASIMYARSKDYNEQFDFPVILTMSEASLLFESWKAQVEKVEYVTRQWQQSNRENNKRMDELVAEKESVTQALKVAQSDAENKRSSLGRLNDDIIQLKRDNEHMNKQAAKFKEQRDAVLDECVRLRALLEQHGHSSK